MAEEAIGGLAPGSGAGPAPERSPVCGHRADQPAVPGILVDRPVADGAVDRSGCTGSVATLAGDRPREVHCGRAQGVDVAQRYREEDVVEARRRLAVRVAVQAAGRG